MSVSRVGWIGLGGMGAPLARHVVETGHELVVWSRSGRGADRAPGARVVDDVADVAAQAEIVVTMLGGPGDVAEVWERLLAGGRAGQIFVDLTTSEAALARDLARRAETVGVGALDAPVTGGRKGAEAGTVGVMVGGEEEAVTRARPVLESFAAAVRHFGPAGTGQLAKAANQLAVAGIMQGLAEALTLARRGALPREALLATLGGGTARSFLLDAYGEKMLDDDRTPGFALRHFIKDLAIAEAAAAELGCALPGAALTRDLYARLDAAGRGDEGIQTLIAALDDRGGEGR